MNVIYKYPLEITEQQIFILPKDSDILDVQFQDGDLCLWALVNTDNDTEQRVIRIFGTGWPIDMYGSPRHISTVQKDGLVWHIFESCKRCC